MAAGAAGKGNGQACPACGGGRLCPQSLSVDFKGSEYRRVFQSFGVERALTVFGGLELGGREARIAADALTELKGRLQLLAFLGLDYLALDRAAPTLSAEGRWQRIRLAAQLGSQPARRLLHPR